MTPSSAGESTYGNFVWVLDSATGDVRAYRDSLKDEGGKNIEWITEHIMTHVEYATQEGVTGLGLAGGALPGDVENKTRHCPRRAQSSMEENLRRLHV